MKFCTECGKELPADAAFCTGCGAKIAEEKTAEVPIEEKAENIEAQATAEVPKAEPAPIAVEAPKAEPEVKTVYVERTVEKEPQAVYVANFPERIKTVGTGDEYASQMLSLNAMYLGIASLFMGPIMALIAIIFSNLSTTPSIPKRNKYAQIGHTCAIVSLIIFAVLVVLAIVLVVLFGGMLSKAFS